VVQVSHGGNASFAAYFGKVLRWLYGPALLVDMMWHAIHGMRHAMPVNGGSAPKAFSTGAAQPVSLAETNARTGRVPL